MTIEESATAARTPSSPAACQLLLLAYYFPPQNTSGAHRPAWFAKYLDQHGVGVTVLTAKEYNGELAALAGEKGELVDVDPEVGWRQRAARLIQRALPYNDQLPWVPQALKTCDGILKEKRFSVVLSSSPPLCTHVVARRLKRERGVKWVADLRDPIAGNPFRRHWFSRRWDRWWEGTVMREADLVIANTDAAASELQHRYPGHAGKVMTLWNGFDPALRLRAMPLPERGHRLLAHFGWLYGRRHPVMLLHSLERLFSLGALDRAGVRMLLRGGLDWNDGWTQDPVFVAMRDSGMVEAVDAIIPRKEAQREMMTSDYLLLLDLNDNDSSLQVPAKIFEYIQIGRPILAYTPKGSPSEQILEGCGIPHVCIDPRDSTQRMDEKVLRFFQLRPEPAEPSEWFLRTFDAEQQTKELANRLAALERAQ